MRFEVCGPVAIFIVSRVLEDLKQSNKDMLCGLQAVIRNIPYNKFQIEGPSSLDHNGLSMHIMSPFLEWLWVVMEVG